MKTILHTVDIAAPPGRVFAALATQQGLSGWWTTRVDADEHVGGSIAFTFHDEFSPRMQITALDPDKRVEWTCAEGHDPWRGNTFRFEIEPRGEGAILFFRQVYARELDDEEYGRYNFNWGYYLESLRKLVVDGKGRPFDPSS